MSKTATATRRVAVVVIDDHRPFLEAICFTLARQPGISVVGSACSGFSGLSLVRSLRPSVAVVDLRMRGMSGAQVTRAVKDEVPDVQVVALTVSPDEEDLSEVLRAGACSYVLKPHARDELPLAIMAAASGESWLTPSMTRKLISSYLRSPSVRHQVDAQEELTPRERSVLTYLAEGRTNREIGQILYIAETTVKTHLKSIFAKLDVRNRAEAAAAAWRLAQIEQTTDSSAAAGADST